MENVEKLLRVNLNTTFQCTPNHVALYRCEVVKECSCNNHAMPDIVRITDIIEFTMKEPFRKSEDVNQHSGHVKKSH